MLQREYPDAPLVGVGAIVILESKVLLVRRAQEPLKGEWSIPGGLVEVGESLEFAVRREVLEETGLEVEVFNLIEVINKVVLDESSADISPFPRVRYHYVLVDFLCRPIGGKLCSGSDAGDARWVEQSEVSTEGVYRLAAPIVSVIEKAFAAHTISFGHTGGLSPGELDAREGAAPLRGG